VEVQSNDLQVRHIGTDPPGGFQDLAVLEAEAESQPVGLAQRCADT